MTLRNDISVKAYAKINLYLDITGRRGDGYHLLETIMQTVSLCDDLSISLRNNGEIVLYADNDFSGDIPCDERNIAVRAAKRFYENTPGLFSGLEIHLTKNIPSQAGLGGGSADAAAVLRGLYELHEKPFEEDRLYNIALSLGADVPFCLLGGAAICHGIGEEMTAVASIDEGLSILIAKGGCGISTAAAFSEIDRVGFAENRTDEILELYHKGDYSSLCFNRFEQVTALDEIRSLKEKMLGFGAKAACMSGSGSAVFGIFKNADNADRLSAELRKNGFFAEVCRAKG
ncbi:MAG: 4-(cytidine 5'-diphospho)-2-C-methyl-D-erythritol kinase [Oscillospiraceae bacterium]|nr:4-(cytidine 5'-diphospho)-2-C-methyl-D-erythritol kinase [Oscillospiraceae bacterium]